MSSGSVRTDKDRDSVKVLLLPTFYMCCFTGAVKRVSSTRIFAREAGPVAPAHQYVVYQMNLDAPRELAMVLPIPTAELKEARAREKAVRFINLDGYDAFFKDLDRGFPDPTPPPGRSLSLKEPVTASAKLEVHQVGSFEASYVPRPTDFARLDERFRISPELWEKIPAYKEFGFAVFKLKQGNQTVHAMAFAFERANANKLFFPTVHIHDGKVHGTANFDHKLYCQSAGRSVDILNWEESRGHAQQFADIKKSKGLLLEEQHVYRKQLSGRLKNADTYLAIG